MKERVTRSIGGEEHSLESGQIAKQANGSILFQRGKTVLLATAVMSKEPKEGIDFFPLTVEYSEKFYSAGKIPGGFFKREARPSVNATLTARLIDRPIRPSFPDKFYNDVQVIITVLSYDPAFPPESMGITAASAALSVSDIPFNGPVASALVAQVDGQFVTNPTYEQIDKSTLEIVVAGTKDAILMVEAGANEVSEETIIDAIQVGHEAIREGIALQEELIQRCAKPKVEFIPPDTHDSLQADIRSFLGNRIPEILEKAAQTKDKKSLEADMSALADETVAHFQNDDEDNSGLIKSLFGAIKKNQIRKTIISKKVRPDGRAIDEVRSLSMELDVLPATHGSALFTRGETQSLGVVTLGTADDEKIEDGLEEKYKRHYYFHYNFPAFSVGEVGRPGTSRRELGHGALAERALESILPKHENFPYTVRVVSEILESNGSSSMASVCSGSMALMACGVPISAPVSGIAMGLLIEDGDYTILSDIQGLEDHYGDMDFKVAGTEKGITALQLDIKVAGLSKEILTNALAQAKKGRAHILSEMNNVIHSPRETVSDNAPRIEFITIDPDKVGLVIGPGGKMIKKIEEESGAAVYITDSDTATVSISASSAEAVKKGRDMVLGLVKEIEVGEVYEGRVVKLMSFGAFIELMPGKEALLHISKVAEHRVENIEDELSVDDQIKVKVEKIDDKKRASLIRA